MKMVNLFLLPSPWWNMDPDLDASVYAIAHTDQPEGIDGDALVIVGQWCASLVSLTGAP